MKINRIKSFYVFLLITIFVFRLSSRRAIVAITYAGHDDRLFFNHAMSILGGEWLGDFSRMTLIKGPIFSVFLSLNFLAGIPVLICQQILYLAAIFALVFSLRKIIKHSAINLTLFTVLALNPYFFYWTRITREPLYTIEAILLVASAVALFLHLKAGKEHKEMALSDRASLLWRCLMGFSYACFWATREEGIWLLPILAPFFIFSLYTFLLSKRARMEAFGARIIRFVRFYLPLALAFFVVMLPIFSLNYFHYGLWGVTDMQSGSLKAAYGSLTRVKGDSWHPYTPVPTSVRERIYAVSPKFAELQPYLEGPVLERWSNPGCAQYPDICDDIAGGWFIWAFRDAVESAGYYESYPASQVYYTELRQEIQAACEDGRLECRRLKASFAPHLNSYYLTRFPAHFLRGFVGLLSLQKFQWSLRSIGSPREIDLFEAFLHTRAVPTIKDSHYKLTGWFTRTDDTSKRVLVNAKNLDHTQVSSKAVIEYLPSPGLAEAFSNPDFSFNRFSVEYFCQENCEIQFQDPDSGATLHRLLLKKDLEERYYEGPALTLNIDSIEFDNGLDNRVERVQAVSSVLPRLIAYVYRVMGWFFIPLGLVSLPAALLLRKQLTSTIVISFCLWSAAALRLSILALIDASSFPGFSPTYLMPCTPLIYAATILSIYSLFLAISKKPVKYGLQ